MVPLLVSRMGLTQVRAHGTSLVAVLCTGVVGALGYALGGQLNVVAALLLASMAMVAARFGARAAHALPEWQLKRGFGFYLLIAALLLIIKPYLPAVGWAERGWGQVAILLLFGGLAGFLSGMMGVGGGGIMVPAMVLLGGFGQHLAQGTSLLAMVPSSSVGVYTHYELGGIERKILPGLLVGVLLGSFLGARVAHLIPDAGLRWIFAVVIAWMSLRYLQARPAPA